MTVEEKAKAYDEAVHHKKVLFADLDGTLIDTVFGNTFPKGIWDMQFKWDVLSAIKEYGFEILITVFGNYEEENMDLKFESLSATKVELRKDLLMKGISLKEK